MVQRSRRQRRNDLLIAAAAGAIGGWVGTWSMACFERLWSTRQARQNPGDPRLHRRVKHAGDGEHWAQSEPRSHEKRQTSSQLAIATMARTLAGRQTTPRQREIGGSVLHYAFGSTAGAAYSATRGAGAHLSLGRGIAYGLLVWLVADEIAMPAMGLADAPSRSEPRKHLYSIGAHVAYGAGLELGRWATNALAAASPRD